MAKNESGTKKGPVKAKVTKAKNATGGVKGDPKEAIVNCMAEKLAVGVTGVKEENLLQATGYSRPDSTGFRNATKELIKELGHLTKAGKLYSLTEKGQKDLLDKGKIAPEPTTNEENQARLKKILSKTVKAPAKNLDAVWNTLIDGEPHSTEELLKASSYQRTDSKGYSQIMKGMGDLELLEKPSKGNFKFSEKVFKFGRP